mmetsp:Transcript_2082/g.3816  ORF Transcript_2082/g.3816 Transcript_2082/m.3816 type:complete len:215 (+) Transcript_2082:199-843(+)
MGNFHSAHMECWIEKQVDLQPGENLKGIVRLNVHNEHSFNESFQGISIVVAGVEYELMGDTVVPTSKVIRVKSLLDMGGHVTKGEHEFPFEIALPTYDEHLEHHDKQQTQEATSYPATASTTTATKMPGLRVLESCESSMSEISEFSMSPFSTTGKAFPPSVVVDGVPQQDEKGQPQPSTTIIYHVKASLKRRKNVKLSVDTDIKCHARCVEVL